MTRPFPATGLRPSGGWRAARSTVGVTLVIAAAVGPLAGVAGADVTASSTFSAPGQYVFTVPAGVTSVAVVAVGAAGGGACDAVGGEGASVSGVFAVVPGEQLDVGVGGPGGTGSVPCGVGTAGGAGGFGGGGAGGTGVISDGGGGGGGASAVGAPFVSAGFPSMLMIAAGGGGAGGGGPAGGNAGSPGGDVVCGAGGAGTSSAGGAGGGSAGDCSGADGTAGSLGLGGSGGGVISGDGGGGGGGGYYGGGGGASPIPGAGGGGGSSFIAQGTLVATPTSAPAGVTFTYDAPTADLSAPSSITFAGTEPQGVASSEEDEIVSNNGSAPLIVSAVALAGSDPGDFLIDDGCQQPVAVGASCEIGVRFDPETQGARSATLTLATNAGTQPAAIDLSGTGAPAGQVVCRDTLLARALCMLEFAPGTYTVQNGSAKSSVIRAEFVIERSGRRIHAGKITVESGRVTDESIGRLDPGRYTLIITTGRGQRRRLLLTYRFQVR